MKQFKYVPSFLCTTNIHFTYLSDPYLAAFQCKVLSMLWIFYLYFRNFKWTYVSIVYSDTEYGNQGYETLQRLAPDYNVCFSTPLRISNQHISDSYYDRIINKLDKNSHARGKLKPVLRRTSYKTILSG